MLNLLDFRARLMLLMFTSAVLHGLVLYSPTFGRGSDGTRAKYVASPKATNTAFTAVTLPPTLEANAPVAPPQNTPTPEVASPTVSDTTAIAAPPVLSVPDTTTDLATAPPKAAESPTDSLSLGTSVLPVEGSAFLPTTALTRPPQPVEYIELNPANKPWNKVEGGVVMTLWIDARGNIVDTKVESNDLPEVVTDFVRRTFEAARFVPGELNGRAVGSMMRIEVRYDDLRSNPPAGKG
jgi:hypothetical protein